MLSFIVSGNGTINAFANNRSYVIPRTHRNYERAKAALATKDPDTFVRAVDYVEAARSFAQAQPHRRVEIVNNQVIYNGRPLHNVITRRILELHADGWPWEPVGNFLDNVEHNPSYRAVQELYTFLEHRALPLTESGHFLAYKAVRPDWKDKHSGTFDNSVGQLVKVPRNTVNDDFREGCSNGLHVGSIEYVQGFKDPDDHVVICRVNPRDVVSVPLDAGCTKLRCCEYLVVGEYKGDLTGLVYTAQGEAVPPPSRNDPAQGVTQAPVPRDAEAWNNVVARDVPLIGCGGEPDADKAFDFTADDVGLGPKDEYDDNEDDSEIDLEDSEIEDGSDLEDEDYDSDCDYESDLEDDEDDEYVDMDEATDLPQAEETNEPAIDTASYAHPFNFNTEYGGES